MLIVQGLNVPCMAAPQKIRIVPNKAKKAVVTPKKPTKKGPTQKSNRSPPISVPPRTRYFLSKLSKAIFVVSAFYGLPAIAATDRRNLDGGRGRAYPPATSVVPGDHRPYFSAAISNQLK